MYGIDTFEDLRRRFIFRGFTNGRIGRNPFSTLWSSKQLAQEYRDHINSFTLDKSLKKSNPFDVYSSSRLKNIDEIANLKDADNKPIAIAETLTKKLAEPTTPEREAVKARLAAALELDPDSPTAKSKAKFDSKMKAIDALIDKDEGFNLHAMGAYIQKQKGKVHNAINTDHQAQIAKIDALTNDLKTAYGMSDADITGLKTAIEDSNKKELEKLEASINDHINAMHQFAEIEYWRIAYLATMWKESTPMRNEMARLAAEKDTEDRGNLEVEINPQSQLARFKNLSPKDLTVMQTITNTEIRHKPGTDDFVMTLPKFGILYYRSEKMALDLLSVAIAVRACGYTSITNSVQYEDKKFAMKIARAQFEAAVKAGFDPEKITTKVNGEEVTVKDLFNNRTNKLELLKQEYKAQLEIIKQITGGYTNNDVADVKNRVKAGRIAEAAAAAASTAPETPGSGTPGPATAA